MNRRQTKTGIFKQILLAILTITTVLSIFSGGYFYWQKKDLDELTISDSNTSSSQSQKSVNSNQNNITSNNASIDQNAAGLNQENKTETKILSASQCSQSIQAKIHYPSTIGQKSLYEHVVSSDETEDSKINLYVLSNDPKFEENMDLKTFQEQVYFTFLCADKASAAQIPEQSKEYTQAEMNQKIVLNSNISAENIQYYIYEDTDSKTEVYIIKTSENYYSLAFGSDADAKNLQQQVKVSLMQI